MIRFRQEVSGIKLRDYFKHSRSCANFKINLKKSGYTTVNLLTLTAEI